MNPHKERLVSGFPSLPSVGQNGRLESDGVLDALVRRPVDARLRIKALAAIEGLKFDARSQKWACGT